MYIQNSATKEKIRGGRETLGDMQSSEDHKHYSWAEAQAWQHS